MKGAPAESDVRAVGGEEGRKTVYDNSLRGWKIGGRIGAISPSIM